MSKLLSALAAASILGACATAQTEPDEFARFLQTAPIRRPARPPDAVAIYRAALPARPFHEIGIISGRGVSYMTTLNLVRKLAGENGCDAISNLVETVSTDTETVWGEGNESWDIYHVTASCLVFGPAGASQPPSSG